LATPAVPVREGLSLPEAKLTKVPTLNHGVVLSSVSTTCSEPLLYWVVMIFVGLVDVSISVSRSFESIGL
jgi:hypothetical protein